MKREESLLNIPIENEFNSRLQRDFCDEDESNSDFEDKSLLSVRISHDDTKDNENHKEPETGSVTYHLLFMLAIYIIIVYNFYKDDYY